MLHLPRTRLDAPVWDVARTLWGQSLKGMTMDNGGIDDIARQLFDRLPEAARTMRKDIENNFRAVLQASLSKLDLTTRTEFDVQAKVLERTRARLEPLELRVAALEKRLKDLEEAVPPPTE